MGWGTCLGILICWRPKASSSGAESFSGPWPGTLAALRWPGGSVPATRAPASPRLGQHPGLQGCEDPGNGLGLLGAVQGIWRRGQAEKQSWELSPRSCLLGPLDEPRCMGKPCRDRNGRENPCSPGNRYQGWQEAEQLLQTPAGVLPRGWGPEPGLGLQRPGLALHPLLLRFALNQGTPSGEWK